MATEKSEKQLQIEVINKLTGEMRKIEVDNAYDAKREYLQLAASKKATDDALKKIKSYLDDYLAEDKEYRFVDGSMLKRRDGRETKTWRVEMLKELGFDEDAIQVVSKIDMTLAKPLVLEMMERGEIAPDSIKKLDETADRKFAAGFLEIK